MTEPKKADYFPEEPEEDIKADEALEKGPEVTEPEDFQAAPADGAPAAPEQPAPPVSLATLSDEELAQEFARRRTAKLDEQIEAAEAHLDALRYERDRLEANAMAVFEVSPAAPPSTKVSDINPMTGEPRKKFKKVLPGTVPASQCDCVANGIVGGCYKCLAGRTAMPTTKLGPPPSRD